MTIESLNMLFILSVGYAVLALYWMIRDAGEDE